MRNSLKQPQINNSYGQEQDSGLIQNSSSLSSTQRFVELLSYDYYWVTAVVWLGIFFNNVPRVKQLQKTVTWYEWLIEINFR